MRDMAFAEPDHTPRLLVVEDDENARTALGDILDLEGFEVILSANGQEALDCLSSRPLPDLIILDLQMPVMNGWQFRREQSKNPRYARVPVIVVTAFPSVGNIEVSAVVHKPVDIQRLLTVVQELLLRVHTYH